MRSLALLLIVAAPASALASASPVPSGPPPPALTVDGPATVRDIAVQVRCTSHRFVDVSARCTIAASFELEATGPVTLTAGTSGDVADLGGATTLAAGDHRRVTITARRRLATSTRIGDAPWIIPPAWSRHPFLGRSARIDQRSGDAAAYLVVGADLVLEGEARLDADGDGRVRIAVDRREVDAAFFDRPWSRATNARPDAPPRRTLAVTMDLPGRGPDRGTLHHGGPFVAAGARDDAFLLRAGYEVSFGEYVFLSAQLESDFDSLFESVVVDVSSPGLVAFIPSLRIGTGLVAGEDLPRGSDVGLRLRLGGNYIAAVGADLDLDYWPTIDQWTITGTGRIGF